MPKKIRASSAPAGRCADAMSALCRQEAEESVVGLQRGGADWGTSARALGRLFVLSPRELSAQRPLVPDACETAMKNKNFTTDGTDPDSPGGRD